MYRCVVGAALLGASFVAVHAQAVRPFPSNALRGQLVVTQPPEVLLNNQPARLSPGSRIRGDNNMLVLSGAAIGQKLLVNYTLDSSGQVHDVWILRSDEAARQPWPTTRDEAQRWSFDAASQTWTKR
ncbi:hypothetical protein [Aquabacterium sp.]|uniref:hypothetical protein n=1 Tax=Aquabacterium sp. TaxID=1872578 RepID=UPI002B655A50|nr:hypothetical protein [Aquabacterium sp.]HSW06120.1 hypothetical protein [Aquabacterium sp.]